MSWHGSQNSVSSGSYSGSLYHYTDKEGARAIAASGKLKPSVGPGDQAFGPGQYFTALPPDTKSKDLLKNNWDGIKAPKKKIEYVVEVPVESMPNVEPHGRSESRDVWVNQTKDPIDLKEAGAVIYKRK